MYGGGGSSSKKHVGYGSAYLLDVRGGAVVDVDDDVNDGVGKGRCRDDEA